MPNIQMGIRYASQKNTDRWLLRVPIDVLRHKQRNHPTALPHLLSGLPSKPIHGQPEIAFRCTCVWTLYFKETKGYLNYIESLGGQSQAWFVHMGRVAKPETLSTPGTRRGLEGGIDRSPQMCKNLGLRFAKESEGYLLSPSLHAASCLAPIWEELPRYNQHRRGFTYRLDNYV